MKVTAISDDCKYKECDGSGFYMMQKGRFEEIAVMCKCFEDKKLMRKIQSAGIASDFANATVKEFDPNMYNEQENIDKAKYAKKIAIRFVERFHDMVEIGKGLYFYSSVKGSGKTRLATSIVNALITKYQVRPLYISSANLLNEIKKTFDPNPENTTYEIVENFKQAEVLVLDDLGVEKTTDWSEEILTQILEDRMNYKRLTIITSNFPIDQLSRKYKMGRIESRIEKMTFPVIMPEESIRKILAKKENDLIAEMFFE